MRLIIFFICFITISCSHKNNDVNNEELNILINKASMKYFQTKNKEYLDSVYKNLKFNKDFRELGLSGKNALPIITVLMNLKKYDELEKLLKSNKSINKYNRLNTLNIVKFFNYYNQDSVVAKKYLYKNIERYNDSLKKTPQDSLIYVDYFSTRMFLVGKKKAIKEIDSMKSENNNYSEIFYEKILKNYINNYPDNLLVH
ncbi:MAG: hypothetical protein ACI9FW_000784 [Flavobacterium sp.]|jgi:hypothetical protein